MPIGSDVNSKNFLGPVGQLRSSAIALFPARGRLDDGSRHEPPAPYRGSHRTNDGGTAMDNFSRHAQARLQQRGIPGPVVDDLLDFGREMHDHRGGRILYFDHRARKSLQAALGGEHYKQVERHLDAYAVLDEDGGIITIGHRRHRINRN